MINLDDEKKIIQTHLTMTSIELYSKLYTPIESKVQVRRSKDVHPVLPKLLYRKFGPDQQLLDERSIDICFTSLVVGRGRPLVPLSVLRIRDISVLRLLNLQKN